MDKTLLIMAAGMGSRYGGDKQVDGMGPNGEILLEYSVFDALAAGFTKVVFIIKRGFEGIIRKMVGDQLAQRVKVEYVYQEFDTLPAWYTLPEGRAVVCRDSTPRNSAGELEWGGCDEAGATVLVKMGWLGKPPVGSKGSSVDTDWMTADRPRFAVSVMGNLRDYVGTPPSGATP